MVTKDDSHDRNHKSRGCHCYDVALPHQVFGTHTHTRAGGSPSVGSAEVLKKNVVESQSDYNLQP